MEFKEFSSDDQGKFLRYIDNALNEEKALALISKRLQDAGLSHESAKGIIQQQALIHASKASKGGFIRLAIGTVAMIVLLLIGYEAPRRGNFYAYAAGAMLGGGYLFFKSRRRLKYLKSIFNS